MLRSTFERAGVSAPVGTQKGPAAPESYEVVQLNRVPQTGLDIDRADDVADHLDALDGIAATRVPERLDS